MSQSQYFRQSLSQVVIELKSAASHVLNEQKDSGELQFTERELLQQLINFHLGRIIESGIVLIKIIQLHENQELDTTQVQALALWG